MSETITDRVQAQYTELPYPPRDPEDERRRFIAVSDFHGLDKISDRCFAGRLPPDQDMRILLAGVGTGDAAVSLGEQLRHTSSEIVCVDLSATSLEIAQKRCEIRSIPNLRWRQGSLLELGPSEGTFDYIDCSGVLHHLENPQAGLKALAQVLEPNGAMGIVVYGKYGRTKIYQTQAMLAKLTEGMTNSQKITTARHFLIEHPDSLDPDLYESALGDESELYDMLLHEHDQPFTVDSLYTRLGQAGLRMVDFVDVRFGSRFAYDPRQYLSEQEYNQRTADLRRIGRQALAERLSGSIRLHSFHATATGRPDTIARSDDPAMIPSYSFGITHELRNRLTGLFVNREKGAITPVRIINGKDVVLPLGPDVSAMFRYLDGNRTSGEIFSLAEAETGMGEPKLQRKLSRVLDLLRGAGWITLRHESLLPYTTAENIQGAQLERQDTLDAKIVIIDNVAEAVRRALDDY